jgi:hypothetical protein
MSIDPDPAVVRRVFDLLPAVYRTRDARPDGRPGFLESLLTVVAAQLELVEDDIAQLYDDLFVETCDAWVLPYIGDLVAVVPGAPVDDDAVLTRAAVTDAIARRRRKGTATVLQELAQDITGWPALAVEMFQHLTIAQHLQHVVTTRGRTVSTRSAGALDLLGRSFDPAAHTLEVRRIGDGRGRYAVPNVAIMVWRDHAALRTEVDAAPVDAVRFRFDPLGCDRRLVTRRQTLPSASVTASPINVPGPVGRRAMAASLSSCYGTGLSVVVRRPQDPDPVSKDDVVVCDLSDSAADGSTWSNVARLAAGQVGIDPELGRLAFGTAQTAPPLVSFVTAQPSDTGGGELRPRPDNPDDLPVTPVRRSGAGGAATTVGSALAACGGNGTVQIEDSRTYPGDLAVSVPAGGSLRLVSADGTWPLLALASGLTITVGERGLVSLRGLLVTGGPLVVRGRPERVELADCTFVPGTELDVDGTVSPPVMPSVVLDLDPDWQTELVVDTCVTGPLSVPADGTTLSIVDSIVDGVDDGLGRAAGVTAATASVVPMLRAPAAPGPLSLPPASVTLRLTLGTDPWRLITLATAPTDVADAAAQLDTALTGTGARAFALADRVVLVGDGRPLAVEPDPLSDLAAALGLVGAAALTRGLVGGPVDLGAAAAGGTVAVGRAATATATVHVPSGASDLPSLATGLQGAIAAADPGLAGIGVGVLASALVLVPGTPAGLVVSPVPDDLTTAGVLGLVSPRPAIAADPTGRPGATLSLERCTVLGSVSVEAVGLVRDSLVTGPLTNVRRQVGCLEYSWIDPASSTARRHECQPASADTPPPRFVATRFAAPGYARLRREGASALVRAASDGYEIGAMARLRQTQRDDNLRRAVAEYLRFGLEAGVLDGT